MYRLPLTSTHMPSMPFSPPKSSKLLAISLELNVRQILNQCARSFRIQGAFCPKIPSGSDTSAPSGGLIPRLPHPTATSTGVVGMAPPYSCYGSASSRWSKGARAALPRPRSLDFAYSCIYNDMGSQDEDSD